MDTEWISDLTETEGKLLLASICHNTIHFDFILTDEEFSEGEDMLQSLNAYEDDNESSRFVDKIPEEHRHMLWAMMMAFIADIHAPVDNLSEIEWNSADELQEILNSWETIPTPSPNM